MRILTRYVLIEFFKVFLTSLSGLTGIIFLAFLAREAVEAGLGPGAVIRLIPYVLPQAMQFAVPGTVLLAVVCVFGRMSASNEIVAIKSAGVSPLAVIGPVLTVIAVISMATVWLNDVAFSWGRRGVQQVLLGSIEEIAYRQLRSQKSFEASGVSINVARVQGRRLLRPMFTIHRGGDQSMTFTADEAEIRSDAAKGAILLRLVRPHSDGNAGFNFDLPDVHEIELSVADFSERPLGEENPSQMPLSAVPSAIDHQLSELQRQRQELTAFASFVLVSGRLEDFGGDDYKRRQSALAKGKNRLARLRTEPHRRWASGFSCLAFALVGIPVSIRRRHAEFLASFFACFLPILLLYYPMLVVGLKQAKYGALPPLCVWTGNLVFSLWGARLLRKVLRY